MVVAAFDFQHGLVLAHVELVELGDLAVILQRLLPGGLLVGTGEGDVADLEELGRSEEGHVAGIVEQRIDQAALVDVGDGEAGALGLDAAGQAGGPGADDNDVEGEDVRRCGMHGSRITRQEGGVERRIDWGGGVRLCKGDLSPAECSIQYVSAARDHSANMQAEAMTRATPDTPYIPNQKIRTISSTKRMVL